MPNTGNGASYRSFREQRKVLRRENSREPRILHAYFERKRTPFRHWEATNYSGKKAEEISEAIVDQDRGENHQARLSDGRTLRGDYAPNNRRKSEDSNEREYAFRRLIAGIFAEEVIKRDAENNRQDRHENDRLEHAECIDVDSRPCEAEHQKRRHDRGEQRRNGCHTDGIRDIAFTQKAHQVRRNAARATTDENKADRDSLVQAKNLYERESYERHDCKLGRRAYSQVERAFGQRAKVFRRERKPHCKHDEPQDERLSKPTHPAEAFGEKISDNSRSNHNRRSFSHSKITYLFQHSLYYTKYPDEHKVK